MARCNSQQFQRRSHTQPICGLHRSSSLARPHMGTYRLQFRREWHRYVPNSLSFFALLDTWR
ncbi:hypothetical protein ACS0TY_011613 [Phlomoides rotata]